jgi:hypothetical protein
MLLANFKDSTEHVLSRKKREEDLANPLKAQVNDALSEPMQIPGILYRQINLNGRSFELGLLWKLSTSSLAYVSPTPPKCVFLANMKEMMLTITPQQVDSSGLSLPGTVWKPFPFSGRR